MSISFGAMTEAASFLQSSQFLKLKAEFISALGEAGAKIKEPRGPKSPEVAIEYQKMIKAFESDRGRELYYPYVSSGFGSGPWVELMDGSIKLDMISGIGVNFFGHAHPALVAEVIDGLPSDIMQGNLQPGQEARALLRALLSRVGEKSRLKHAWLHCSGTMANETALKVIRQKKFPATRIFAFKDCFAGRSTAMQEITDSPKYREGQPTYGEVTYLPFFDAQVGLDESVRRVFTLLNESTSANPGKYAAIMMELVQGEGGFNYAPREFYVRVFEEAKRLNLAIWIDEIQTFGRTGELFAYQTFGLDSYVDVVTVGKLLQACAAIYAAEFNPKPGLLAGTFTGSVAALRSGRRILELLDEGKFFGSNGRINALSKLFAQGLEKLATGTCKGWIGERRIIGGMVAFKPFSGSMDDIKALLTRMFDLGVVAFFCGHDPYLIRMLPPLGAMTEEHVQLTLSLIEKAIIEVAPARTGGRA